MLKDSEQKGSKRLPQRPRFRIFGAAGKDRYGCPRVIDLLPMFDEFEKPIPDHWVGFAQLTRDGWRIPVFSTTQLQAKADKLGWKVRILQPEI